MTDKEIKQIHKYIIDTDKKCGDDVIYALALLDTSVESMLESVKGKISDNTTKNNFSEVARLVQFCNSIIEIREKIQEYITYMTPIDYEKQSQEKKDDELLEKDEKRGYVNYSNYAVKRDEIHFLNEDFTHKRICAFDIDGRRIEVGSWQDALVKVCEVAYRKSPMLVNSFVGNPDFQGNRVSYFERLSVPNKNVRICDSDIYVWINLSANQIAAMIKKILKYMRIREDCFKIYLRADYTELHK